MRFGLMLLVTALLVGCPTKSDESLVETVASPDVAESCTWTPLFSGRIYQDPPGAWTTYNLANLSRVLRVEDQIHWFIEIEVKDSQEDSSEVCSLNPRDRAEGAGTCTSDRVGRTTALGALRTTIKAKLEGMGFLPEDWQGEPLLPRELGDQQEFLRMVEQAVDRLQAPYEGQPVEFCGVRLAVAVKKRQTSDGVWWEPTQVTYFGTGGGCCE